MDQLKGAVERLRALKAVRALEGNAADVDGGLLLLRDALRAGIEIVLDAMQVGCQRVGAFLLAEELAEDPQRFLRLAIQRRVAPRNHDDRDPGLALQLVGVNACI